MGSVPSWARSTRSRSVAEKGRWRQAMSLVRRGASPRSMVTSAASAPSAEVPLMIPTAHAWPTTSLRLIARPVTLA